MYQRTRVYCRAICPKLGNKGDEAMHHVYEQYNFIRAITSLEHRVAAVKER